MCVCVRVVPSSSCNDLLTRSSLVFIHFVLFQISSRVPVRHLRLQPTQRVKRLETLIKALCSEIKKAESVRRRCRVHVCVRVFVRVC